MRLTGASSVVELNSEATHVSPPDGPPSSAAASRRPPLLSVNSPARAFGNGYWVDRPGERHTPIDDSTVEIEGRRSVWISNALLGYAPGTDLYSFLNRPPPPQAFRQHDGGWVVAPPGVDVFSNIGQAGSHRNDGDLEKNLWFKSMVETGGPWDYKTRGPSYEFFGNWHFGVVGAAAGFDEAYLLQAAGLYQVIEGKSRRDWGWPRIPGLPQTGRPPYGDQPSDQHAISLGVNWYQNRNAGGN